MATWMKRRGRMNEQQTVEFKRKALTDELDVLKKNRVRMEVDIYALGTAVDEYAEKAESSSNLTLITKSNRFC